MKLAEFINKKYPGKMLEQKKVIKEYKENEKKKKKYFILKNKPETRMQAEWLAKDIIW